MPLLRDFFIGLSENQILNLAAQKFGLRLGANSVVAGTNIYEMIDSVKELNKYGISCTVDNLGEFVSERSEALQAKEQILEVIEAIYENQVDAHISIKPSQLGLDIDVDFCFENIREIVDKANNYNMHVNIDMENYSRLQPTFDILDRLAVSYSNVGTVIQAYLFNAMENIKKYKNFRMRIVKGAYKEDSEVAYQNKEEIDRNFIDLIEYHLLHGQFTSIATHDHKIINYVKQFVMEKNIPKDKFEFQMLYGFRKELQVELAKEGYNFCTYVPFGKDWYGYFMRRLAERPQNIQLVTKQVFNKKTNTILGVAAAAFIFGRLTKKNK